MTESDAMTDEIEDQGDDATLPADEASPVGGPEAPAGAEDEDEADEREPEPGEPGPWSPDESVSTEGEAVASPEQDLTLLRGELDALNERHLRLAAEFMNYRRRVEQERNESWSRAQADLVGRLLEVVDDLQRVAGLDLSNATAEAIMEGVDLVERKFARALEDAGVEVIDPEGELFDPETMEAVMRVSADSEEEDDSVAQVFQKGYAFKGRLVRPARVSVRKSD